MTQDLKDLSDGAIIDRIGTLSVRIDDLQRQSKECIVELLSRGFTAGDGEFFHGSTIDSYIQWGLDRKKLEADKGEALRPYLRPRNISATIKVTARKDVAAAAVMAAE